MSFFLVFFFFGFFFSNQEIVLKSVLFEAVVFVGANIKNELITI